MLSKMSKRSFLFHSLLTLVPLWTNNLALANLDLPVQPQCVPLVVSPGNPPHTVTRVSRPTGPIIKPPPSALKTSKSKSSKPSATPTKAARCTSTTAVFHLNITWGDGAPDGFTREQFFINGQFPGPQLEITQGDEVVVHIENDSPYPVTIHFHGIEQHRTPWSDGVPGVTQRAIPGYGGKFTAKWTATQYGAYWYHAHVRGQLDDGLYGPITIHPSCTQKTPFSLISNNKKTLAAIEHAARNVQPVLLNDWNHHTSLDRDSVVKASGITDLCYDSILINGKGNVNCWSQSKINQFTTNAQRLALSAVNATSLTAKGCLPATVVSLLARQVPKDYSVIPDDYFNVCTGTSGSRATIDVVQNSTSGEQWLALDLIAGFGLLSVVFSIDNHPMYIYAVDGSYIEPILVDAIPMFNGARFSVLIKLKDLGNYYMRVASNTAAQSIANYAVLSYHAPGKSAPSTVSVGAIDDGGVNTTAQVTFFNQAAMKAYPPAPVQQTADNTFILHMIVAGQTYLWALNSTIYPLTQDTQTPVLFNPQPLARDNVTLSTQNNTWVDVVFVTATFPQPPHPMHKHGSKMFLIGQGLGPFNWSSVAEAQLAQPGSFNLNTPPMRDTLTTAATTNQPAWLAVRYYSGDPGAWFLHCHIENHMDGGMSVTIQDGIDAWPQVPSYYANYGS